MRCCHCNKQILQQEFDNGEAYELMGQYSHKACDIIYFEKQEKLVNYTKRVQLLEEF